MTSSTPIYIATGILFVLGAFIPAIHYVHECIKYIQSICRRRREIPSSIASPITINNIHENDPDQLNPVFVQSVSITID